MPMTDDLVTAKSELAKVLGKGSPLTSQPEDLVADAYVRLTGEQKKRFVTIAETLRAEYEDQIDSVQLAMAALAAVVQVSAMKHFIGVVNGEAIDAMSEEEVQALEYARKLYNENVNAVLKSADSGTRDSNFLRELDEFMMTRHADGTISVTGKKTPKLSLSQVIDIKPVQNDSTEADDAEPAAPVARRPASPDDVVAL